MFKKSIKVSRRLNRNYYCSFFPGGRSVTVGFCTVLFCVFISGNLYPRVPASWQKTVDSLKVLINNSNSDSAKISNYIVLFGKYFKWDKYETCESVFNEMLAYSQKNNYTKGVALAYLKKAKLFKLGYKKYPEAVMFYRRGLKAGSELNDKRILYEGFYGLGTAYSEMGDHEKAGTFLFKALKMAEALKDEQLITSANGGLGNFFNYTQKYDKAFHFHKLSLEFYIRKNDLLYQSHQYLNCGLDLAGSNKNDSALLFFEKALEIQSAQKNFIGTAFTYNGIASVYFNKKEFKKAIEITNRAVAYLLKDNEPTELARSYSALGKFYFSVNKFDSSEFYYKKTLLLATQTRVFDRLSEAYAGLYELYYAEKKTEQALTYYKKYILIKDSLSVLKAQSKLESLLNDFDDEKREKERIFNEKLLAQQNKLKLDKEKNRRNFSLFVGGLLLLFAIYIFRALKRKEKDNRIIQLQKKEVENQKHIIEEKQQEILDSIRYAKRIQQSLLPSEHYFIKTLEKLENEKKV